jgi:hypothetical protein
VFAPVLAKQSKADSLIDRISGYEMNEKERRLAVIWEGQLSAFDPPEDVLYATLVAGWDFGAVWLAYAGL